MLHRDQVSGQTHDKFDLYASGMNNWPICKWPDSTFQQFLNLASRLVTLLKTKVSCVFTVSVTIRQCRHFNLEEYYLQHSGFLLFVNWHLETNLTKPFKLPCVHKIPEFLVVSLTETTHKTVDSTFSKITWGQKRKNSMKSQPGENMRKRNLDFWPSEVPVMVRCICGM